MCDCKSCFIGEMAYFSTLNYLLISPRSQCELAERREDGEELYLRLQNLMSGMLEKWNNIYHHRLFFIFLFVLNLNGKFASKIRTCVLISVGVWMIANSQRISRFPYKKLEACGCEIRAASHAVTSVSRYNLVNDCRCCEELSSEAFSQQRRRKITISKVEPLSKPETSMTSWRLDFVAVRKSFYRSVTCFIDNKFHEWLC